MQISSKALVLRALLERGNVYLHLDATKPGVEVPSHLKDDEALTLVVGHNLAIPIPDLEIGPEGVTATLSFSQTPFHCRIPWKALFAMSTEDGRSLVWSEDAPEAMRAAFAAAGKDDEMLVDPSGLLGPLDGEGDEAGSMPMAENRHKGPDRSLFGVVEGERQESSDKDAGTRRPKDAPEPPGGSHLRLVD